MWLDSIGLIRSVTRPSRRRAHADVVRVPVDQPRGVMAPVATPDLNDRVRAAIADGDGSGIDDNGYVEHRIRCRWTGRRSSPSLTAGTNPGPGPWKRNGPHHRRVTREHSREMHKGEDGISRRHSLLASGGDC